VAEGPNLGLSAFSFAPSQSGGSQERAEAAARNFDRAAGRGLAEMLSVLVLALAVLVSVVAVYQWTGLARYWSARKWTTALAVLLWLAWFFASRA
jgi:predicted ferric reductase